MLQACLGIHVLMAKPEIRLNHPRLPEVLGEVRVLNLQVGQSSVDLLFRRSGTRVDTEVIGRRGDIEVREVM